MGIDRPPVSSVAGTYRLFDKLGAGSFGSIFLAQKLDSPEEFAVKLERNGARHPQVIYEAKVLKILSGGGARAGTSGSIGEFRHLLGSTTLAYRDIKPDNFLMGTGQRTNQINCIDFGLAKRFRNVKTNTHISYKENKNLTGTARYASLNTHLGIEQSRRDDLESLGYVLLYFLRGSLPWQGLRAPNRKQKYEKICFAKLSITVEQLCEGHPQAFVDYFRYVRDLGFEDRPDYTYLRRLLRDLFVEKGFSWDYVFDWTALKAQQVANMQPMYGSTSKLLHFSSALPDGEDMDSKRGEGSHGE